MFKARIANIVGAVMLAIFGALATAGSANASWSQPLSSSSDAPMISTDRTAVAPLDDSHCPSGYACFWTGSSFDGNKVLRGAQYAGTGWHPFDNTKRSAKNSFGNHIVCYKTPSGISGWILPSYSVTNTAIARFKVLNTGVGTSHCPL
jgi:hypothetical protein